MVNDVPLGPYGLDAAKCATLRTERTVLVPVHHVTAGTRLAEVVPMLEADRRVQVVYTQAPTMRFGAGTEEYLRCLGGVVIPWRFAIATPFDLAVAATHGGLENLHAPVLLLPHGIGFSKLQPRWDGGGPPARRYMGIANPASLVKFGRVVPSVIALAHERQVEQLAEACPEAAPVARVTGDPAYDRLLAGAPHRQPYREALGVRPGQKLVVVTSTHWITSLLGRHRDLLPQLMAALPEEGYRVVAVIHPNVWNMHGRRQVRAWFDECSRAGLRMLPPERGWHGALVASDLVIGDGGSVTYYGAAIGRPVLRAVSPEDDVDPDSQVARLAQVAPRLDAGRPLRPQIDAAIRGYVPSRYAEIRAWASSAPGRSAALIRSAMYELMDLPEPVAPARIEAAPVPVPLAPFREAA